MKPNQTHRPVLSYLVVSRNNESDLMCAVNSLRSAVTNFFDLTVILVTNLDGSSLELKLRSAGANNVCLVILEGMRGYSESLIAGAKAAAQMPASDLYIVGNDDVIFFDDFGKKLAALEVNPSTVIAPMLYTSNGELQRSVYRKKYTKLDLFIRHQDGGIFSHLQNNSRIGESLNLGRETVDGCLLVLQNIEKVHLLFNPDIFLYYEECWFQKSGEFSNTVFKVDEELKVTHKGGGSVSHGFSLKRLRLARNSRLLVAKEVLNMSDIELVLLRFLNGIEIMIRLLLRI